MKKWLDIHFVLLIGGFGILLSWVGWQARLLDFDHLGHVYDALSFLENGTIPVRGNVTSTGAFSPPGNTWLYVPGVALADYFSLFPSVGSAALYLGTLLGIYLTAERYAGRTYGLFATAVFAFSDTGNFFASSLLAVGNPFFIVWMLYFTCRWVAERDSRFLVAGFFVWGMGMYVFLVTAPAAFIFPVLWFLFRPPWLSRYWLVAFVTLLLVWSPYLVFDGKEGFANTISQVSRTSAVPNDFERTWGDPSLRRVLEDQAGGLDLAGRPAETVVTSTADRLKMMGIAVAGRLSNIGNILTGSFTAKTGSFLVGEALGTIMGAVVVLISIVGLAGALKEGRGGYPAPWRFRLNRRHVFALGIALLIIAAVTNEVVLAKIVSKDGHLWPSEVHIIRQFQLVSALVGLMALFSGHIHGILRSVARAAEGNDEKPFLAVLSLSFLVPAVLLLVLAEPGVGRRFEWLWPYQCLLVSYFALDVLPRLTGARGLRTAVPLLVLVLLSWGTVRDGVRYWIDNGFSGVRHKAIDALEFIADAAKAEGRHEVALGYNIRFSGFQAAFNAVDPRYKVGAVYDFALLSEFGVANTNTLAEGLSPDDEFRLVSPAPEGKGMSLYLPPPAEGYSTIGTFGPYRVLRRTQWAGNGKSTSSKVSDSHSSPSTDHH